MEQQNQEDIDIQKEETLANKNLKKEISEKIKELLKNVERGNIVFDLKDVKESQSKQKLQKYKSKGEKFQENQNQAQKQENKENLIRVQLYKSQLLLIQQQTKHLCQISHNQWQKMWAKINQEIKFMQLYKLYLADELPQYFIGQDYKKQIYSKQIEKTVNKIKEELKFLNELQIQPNYKKGDQMKSYFGDEGKITNFHFVRNQENLIPVLRKIDPEIFKNKENIKKNNIQDKQIKSIQKHIYRSFLGNQTNYEKIIGQQNLDIIKKNKEQSQIQKDSIIQEIYFDEKQKIRSYSLPFTSQDNNNNNDKCQNITFRMQLQSLRNRDQYIQENSIDLQKSQCNQNKSEIQENNQDNLYQENFPQNNGNNLQEDTAQSENKYKSIEEFYMKQDQFRQQIMKNQVYKKQGSALQRMKNKLELISFISTPQNQNLTKRAISLQQNFTEICNDNEKFRKNELSINQEDTQNKIEQNGEKQNEQQIRKFYTRNIKRSQTSQKQEQILIKNYYGNLVNQRIQPKNQRQDTVHILSPSKNKKSLSLFSRTDQVNQTLASTYRASSASTRPNTNRENIRGKQQTNEKIKNREIFFNPIRKRKNSFNSQKMQNITSFIKNDQNVKLIDLNKISKTSVIDMNQNSINKDFDANSFLKSPQNSQEYQIDTNSAKQIGKALKQLNQVEFSGDIAQSY
ncbi:hypothetical protein PPERSA_05792 [Pseudocohnilembus persalinus]|uniref:Uncharacterized protein n=1 Tax=Pseudocohnilembus persalinus TaxID=266149 RepID=A0A0V0QZS0_PSEPJ|nr:hypothetical protein PPERSA_05792 [Pseudocohnilembus persalinus]|eukprot:KRX07729.1 hypothetical protein PPERSA_05792 [Pseudocohnilembus persalinus]